MKTISVKVAEEKLLDLRDIAQKAFEQGRLLPASPLYIVAMVNELLEHRDQNIINIARTRMEWGEGSPF